MEPSTELQAFTRRWIAAMNGRQLDTIVNLFANDPELLQNITPADLPTSYKVFLKDGSSSAVLSLTEEFRKQPGVKEVVAALPLVWPLASTAYWPGPKVGTVKLRLKVPPLLTVGVPTAWPLNVTSTVSPDL